MTNKKALHITGKDSTFIDCDIEGVKDGGQGTLMVKSRIFNFRKDHPNLWIGTIITLLVMIIGSVVSLLIEYRYFVK